MDLARALVGLLLFLAPGVAWTWALGPALSTPQKAVVSVVMAFTLVPGILLALNLLLNVPIDLATGSALAAALTAIGIGAILAPRLRGQVASLRGGRGGPPEG